jgi:predicted enzyme related to lactoylglutathione lyase
MPSKFFWCDVMTTDTKAARRFYCDVVGWGAQDSCAPGMEYTVFTVNDRGVAGLMPIPDDARASGVPPMWVGYIAVDDVDEATQRLEREGGKVHRPPTEVPGIIRFAVVADPQGAGFIIAKGLVADAPPDLAPGHARHRRLARALCDGRRHGLCLLRTNVRLDQRRCHGYGSDGQIPAVRHGRSEHRRPPAVPVPHWTYYFNVSAIDAAAARVTSGGGRIINGPMQVPGDLWIVSCFDPQGAGFALVAPKR